MLTLDADALARFDSAHRPNPKRRPVPIRATVPGDDWLITVELPGPLSLAELIVFDLPAFRDGSALHIGETPELTPLRSVTAAVLGALERLEARAAPSAAYEALYCAARTPSSAPALTAYAESVARCLRDLQPPLPKPPKAPRPPRQSPRQYRERYRHRQRALEVASTAKWLTFWLDLNCWDDEDDDTPPHEGMRVLGHELYEFGADAVEGDPIDEDDDTDDGPVFIRARPINFYRALDAVLGPRRRSKHGHVWIVPPLEAAIARAEQVLSTSLEEYVNGPLFTREELLAEMARQERESLALSDAAVGDGRLAPVLPLRSVS